MPMCMRGLRPPAASSDTVGPDLILPGECRYPQAAMVRETLERIRITARLWILALVMVRLHSLPPALLPCKRAWCGHCYDEGVEWPDERRTNLARDVH